jgi:hypothetical protein
MAHAEKHLLELQKMEAEEQEKLERLRTQHVALSSAENEFARGLSAGAAIRLRDAQQRRVELIEEQEARAAMQAKLTAQFEKEESRMCCDKLAVLGFPRGYKVELTAEREALINAVHAMPLTDLAKQRYLEVHWA